MSCAQPVGHSRWTVRPWAHDDNDDRREGATIGRLYGLIQAHIDAQRYKVSEREIARDIGVSPTTLKNWRTPTKLIEKRHLEAIARVTGNPYPRVLDALLEDIDYLHPDPPSVERRQRSSPG